MQLDLDLVPLTELIDAIERRSKLHAIVIKHADSSNLDVISTFWSENTGMEHLLGLCELLKRDIINGDE